MTLSTFTRVAFAAALAAGWSAASAADDSMLDDLAGNWTGTGKAQRRVDGPLEPVKCKITSILDKNGLELTQSGRCATTDQTSSIAGIIRFVPASGRYTGTWKTLADGRVADLDGRADGDILVLAARERDSGATGTIELVPRGEGRYTMRITSTSGSGRVASSEISFARR